MNNFLEKIQENSVWYLIIFVIIFLVFTFIISGFHNQVIDDHKPTFAMDGAWFVIIWAIALILLMVPFRNQCDATTMGGMGGLVALILLFFFAFAYTYFRAGDMIGALWSLVILFILVLILLIFSWSRGVGIEAFFAFLVLIWIGYQLAVVYHIHQSQISGTSDPISLTSDKYSTGSC